MQAFENCHNLNSVIYFGENNPSFESNVFESTSISNIYVLNKYKNDNFCNYPLIFYEKSKESVLNGDSITYFIENDTLTIKGNGKINDYENGISNNPPWNEHKTYIKTIIISTGVTSIGDFSFSGFYYLQHITIPESVISIGNYAFSDCFDLQHISIPESVISIGDHAFDSCIELQNITIPKGIKSISRSVFFNCGNLQHITIPESVTSIGQNAFGFCGNLNNVIILGNINNIGSHAFKDCHNLNSMIYFGENNPSFDSNVFEGTNINNIFVLNKYKNDFFGNYSTILLDSTSQILLLIYTFREKINFTICWTMILFFIMLIIDTLYQHQNKDINSAHKHIQKKEIKILDEDDIKSIEKIEEVGHKGGGKVYKVSKKETYALKKMNVKTTDIEKLQQFISEYEILNFLDHPNILKAYGIFMGNEQNHPSILLEYCYINLQTAIEQSLLTTEQRVESIYQIAEGMRYIHFKKIIHRDLKPSNILIGSNGTIKICDFGISKIKSIEQQTMTIAPDISKFMAPEIINEEECYNEKVDVYSFGVLIFFIISGGELPKIKLFDIGKGKKADIPTSFTQFAKELILDCWNFDASTRPSFKVILDRMEESHYNLLKMNKSGIKSVEEFIKLHKARIIPYDNQEII